MKALVATVLSVCLGVAVLPASSDAARMTLFHGTIRVDYGQAYIASSHLPDFEESFFDCQTNGLAGAAVPGFIYLVNGLHTGNVRFRVELVGREPPVDHQWEDIVEVSFKPTGTEVRLVEWDQREYPLALPAALSYRVRYSSMGMDEAFQGEGRTDRPIESHLVTFWPAPPSSDRIVRSTSRQAAYWHKAWWENGSRRPGPDCP